MQGGGATISFAIIMDDLVEMSPDVSKFQGLRSTISFFEMVEKMRDGKAKLK